VHPQPINSKVRIVPIFVTIVHTLSGAGVGMYPISNFTRLTHIWFIIPIAIKPKEDKTFERPLFYVDSTKDYFNKSNFSNTI